MIDGSSFDLEYKILLFGDSSSGKQDLLVRYLGNSLGKNQVSTIGFYVRHKDIVKDNKKIRLTLWDTDGQERFNRLNIQYFIGADGIILVCDITNKETFSRVGIWLEDIENSSIKGKVEIIIIANKIDLEDQRKISENELKEFGEKKILKYLIHLLKLRKELKKLLII